MHQGEAARDWRGVGARGGRHERAPPEVEKRADTTSGLRASWGGACRGWSRSRPTRPRGGAGGRHKRASGEAEKRGRHDLGVKQSRPQEQRVTLFVGGNGHRSFEPFPYSHAISAENPLFCDTWHVGPAAHLPPFVHAGWHTAGHSLTSLKG
jgi:hypothetical protein